MGILKSEEEDNLVHDFLAPWYGDGGSDGDETFFEGIPPRLAGGVGYTAHQMVQKFLSSSAFQRVVAENCLLAVSSYACR